MARRCSVLHPPAGNHQASILRDWGVPRLRARRRGGGGGLQVPPLVPPSPGGSVWRVRAQWPISWGRSASLRAPRVTATRQEDQYRTRSGRAMPGRAGPGRAGPGRAGPGRAGPGLGWAGHDETGLRLPPGHPQRHGTIAPAALLLDAGVHWNRAGGRGRAGTGRGQVIDATTSGEEGAPVLEGPLAR